MTAVTNEIWSRADQLVKQYGETAPEAAAHEADRLHQAGEMAAEETWLRVVTASKAVLARDLTSS